MTFKDSRAQSSLEYIIIIGIGLAILSVFLIYSFAYSSSYTNYQTSQSTTLSTQTISQEADYILTQAVGSSVSFSLPLQELGVPASFFCGSHFVLATNTTDSIGYANSNIVSLVPLTSGTYQASAQLYNIGGVPTVYIKFNLPVSYINYSYERNSLSVLYNITLYSYSGNRSTSNTIYSATVYGNNKQVLASATNLIASNGYASGNLTLSSATSNMIMVIDLTYDSIASSTCLK